MDKNAIKKYAVWARRELIERVSQRALIYGISADTQADANAVIVNGQALDAVQQKQRKALIEQIKEKGYEQVMEEVAYTWFNRFAALRFMEVNGYLPSHIRVFTDDDGAFQPQILTEAIHLDLDGLDMEKVYTLERDNKKEELFKYLLIVQCNALSSILPGMFQKIEDYTELLLPDYLLREGSVIEQMVTMIPEEDWTDQVQIIGWLYQYYNTEPKDQVFADLKKNIKISKEKIPAATQLFTPDWIVHYMVENSLGRLWIEGHPDSAASLLPSEEEQSAYAAGERSQGDTKWHYYLEEAKQKPEVEAQLKEIRKEYAALKPEEILCIDPCMGSGHILCVLFDVLVRIYEDYGYSSREAAVSIVQNNLWGLDIDDRAAQLAYFAVMMKARQYDRRFFSRHIQPHVYAIAESNHVSHEAVKYLCKDDAKLTAAMQTIITELHDAKEYGSILNTTPQDWDALYARFDEIKDDISIYKDASLALEPLVQIAQTLGQKYHVVVTNPPYMGSSNMNPKLAGSVKKQYPNTKSDMSTVMMERALMLCDKNGYMAMINIPVWMFLSSYKKMRIDMLQKYSISSMVHLGRGMFGADFGTTAFVIGTLNLPLYQATYLRLFNEPSSVESEDIKEYKFFCSNRYCSSKNNFSKIVNEPIVYWLGDKMYSLLASNDILENHFDIGSGLSTADNERFLRYHWEVAAPNIAENKNEIEKKWFHIQKGGEFRRWYGNLEYVVNWKNEGEEIKYWVTHNPRDPNTTSWSRRIFNVPLYFKHGITWSVIGIGKISFRETTTNSMISNAAGGIFSFESEKDFYNLLGGLNTKVWGDIFQIISPTVNYSAGVIQKAPFPSVDCNELVCQCLGLSKQDWDSFEKSWEFTCHPMLAATRETLQSAWYSWRDDCEKRFQTLKSNEEELNRIFINFYSLQDELTPEVADKDVTVRRFFDTKDDIPESMRGSAYALTKQDAVKSLISYAVGCMFGRYSLDEEGLAYAGGEWDASKYKTFPADKDAIIPICDDEYFAGDIVGLFVKFIETVYGADTLEENLRFIADALGTKGSTSREVIRNYFLNDFYKDHLKTYQKRPIYWLFDSGKKNGFKCLVYMHRYQPDTIARIRTDYVHEQQSRYRTAIADLEQRVNNASASERVKLNKLLQKLQGQNEEVRIYEEKIHHLADQYIAIDLDDGVKVNYARFQDVLAKIR